MFSSSRRWIKTGGADDIVRIGSAPELLGAGVSSQQVGGATGRDLVPSRGDRSHKAQTARALARRGFFVAPTRPVVMRSRKGDSDRSEPPLLGTHGFRLVQTDLLGNSEYCAEKSCRSTLHHSRTTGTQRTERELRADAVYRP